MTYPSPSTYPSSSLTVTYPSPSAYPASSLFPGTTGVSGGGPVVPPKVGTWTSAGGELTVTFNTAAIPPRAEISVSWPGATTVRVTRTDPNNEQLPVRLAEPATLDAAGGWSGFDYELPYGVGVTYTVTSAQKTTAPTVTTGVFDVPVAWASALIHPQAPSLSVPITLKAGALSNARRAARQSSLVVMNRKRPVVVSDVRESPSSSLAIWCETEQDEEALNGVLSDGSALRLVCDARLGLRVPQIYIAVGDQDTGRPDNAPGDLQARIVTLPFQEVDRPAGKFRGGTAGETGSGFWTYATAQAAYSTYSAAQAAFATYADAALDRVR